MDGSEQDVCFTKKPCQDWEAKDVKRGTSNRIRASIGIYRSYKTKYKITKIMDIKEAIPFSSVCIHLDSYDNAV